MEWSEPVTAETIKAKLPLEWVISQRAGVVLAQSGEKSSGVCPFHDDNDPSLDVYADGLRWGCFPCGLDGDVFDFIGQQWGLRTFPAQLEMATKLLSEFEDEGGTWERIASEQPAVDLSHLREEALKAHQIAEDGRTGPIEELLSDKALDIPVAFLHDRWKVGVSAEGNVIAPYVSMAGEFVSYKTRYSGAGWYARKGGKLTSMYGEWQLNDVDAGTPVWLFEGETDTWLGSWLLGERGVALGLPTGAGSTIQQEWVDMLRGRRVTIVFDADEAGRKAARLWHRALSGVAVELKVAWPSGGDLCESPNPRAVLYGGETVPSDPGAVAILPDGAGYAAVKTNGDLGAQLTNWTLTPMKRIVNIDVNGGKSTRGMEAVFDDAPSTRVYVPDTVWSNNNAMLRWVQQHNRSWLGSGTKQSMGIFARLVNETPFLGTETGVEVVGLHGTESGSPVFVLPDTVIGSRIAAERWRYTPPSTGAADFSRYKLDGDWSIAGEEFNEWAAPVVRNMLLLNHQSVMTPLIAWIAAAPGRSLRTEWPPFGVFGGSGTGKTTVVGAVLKHLSGLIGEHNLTSTTPHGVRVWVSSTNALVIWFDEFRHGASKNTMNMMRQTLRDAYSGSSSSRGGYGDNYADLHESKVIAPIIVSGEESLEERSHIDRVAAVSLRPEDRNPGALRVLQEALVTRDGDATGRLGRSYLEWFIRQAAMDRLGAPKIVHNRELQGEAVLEWGWGLWHRYCADVIGVDVGIDSLDLSNVRGERKSADLHPIVTALHEAINLEATEPHASDGIPVAWVTKQHGEAVVGSGAPIESSIVAVRVRAFHRWATEAGYTFPGGERSTRNWLENNWATAAGDRASYGMGSAATLRVVKLIDVV